MKLCLITCFCGRAEKVERILKFYLDQTIITPSTLLLYNNSPFEMRLDDIPTLAHKSIILVNNSKDLQTKKEYESTGAIFRDAMTFVPPDTDIVSFMDSDDIFLPYHAEQGVEGMKQAIHQGKVSFKPYYSWFIYGDKIEKSHNNLEPSIFVDYQYIMEKGFSYTSASYHDGWLLDAKGSMIEDRKAESTLIYDWSKDHGTYKISGSGDDGPINLKKHREYETDYGDGILTPASDVIVNKCYNLVQL